jgi:iron complex transport system ATP-binding protein
MAELTALRCTDLHVDLDGAPILHGLNLALHSGQWTAVVGPNGAGKSTLLKALAGLTVVRSGQIRVADHPLHAMPRAARARALAWLGQNERGSEDMSAWDVAMLGRLPHQSWFAAPSERDQQIVTAALRATQAWDYRHRLLGSLSGGERQRALLARLLAVRAPILLMDEPLNNLDAPHQADWLTIVRGLVAHGSTVVSVLHEVSMALYADQLVLMAQGRIVHHGATHLRQTHDALEAVFDHRIRIRAVDEVWVALPTESARVG